MLKNGTEASGVLFSVKIMGRYPFYSSIVTAAPSITRHTMELEQKSFSGENFESVMETDSIELVQQETELETDLSGLDKERPEEVTASSGIVQQENTELSREQQEPSADTFSVEPSTPSASVPSIKTPVKVRLCKSDMCKYTMEMDYYNMQSSYNHTTITCTLLLHIIMYVNVCLLSMVCYSSIFAPITCLRIWHMSSWDYSWTPPPAHHLYRETECSMQLWLL